MRTRLQHVCNAHDDPVGSAQLLFVLGLSGIQRRVMAANASHLCYARCTLSSRQCRLGAGAAPTRSVCSSQLAALSTDTAFDRGALSC